MEVEDKLLHPMKERVKQMSICKLWHWADSHLIIQEDWKHKLQFSS